MPNCAICNNHAATGLVVHKDCYEEMQKMLKAKEEGRLVELPIKPGTTVWVLGRKWTIQHDSFVSGLSTAMVCQQMAI